MSTLNNRGQKLPGEFPSDVVVRVGSGRRPRWRCADPTCPAHRWQPVTTLGEYDDMDVALGELEAHCEREHRDDSGAAA